MRLFQLLNELATMCFLFSRKRGGQLVNLAPINRGLEGEIEVVQGLLDGKSRHLDLLLS